jgi:hypothetical protein
MFDVGRKLRRGKFAHKKLNKDDTGYAERKISEIS